MNKEYLYISIILFITFLLSSCDKSVVEPESTRLLAIQTISSDSIKLELDNEIIYEGKVVHSGILGVSWFKLFENESAGLHSINYKSYRFNKEAEHKFYFKDTLTVMIAYDSNHDIVNFVTYNYIIYPE